MPTRCRTRASFFVNQATPQGIAYGFGGRGPRDSWAARASFAIITATLTAGNQREWLKYMDAYLPQKYPKMKLVAVRPSDDLKDKAQSEATRADECEPES